jgi:hypothetical protein
VRKLEEKTMSKKVETIQDKHGDVWTGRVVDKSPSLGEVAVSALFLGLPLIADTTRTGTTRRGKRSGTHREKSVVTVGCDN